MKKYLLIPMFFIAALATVNANCGSCEGNVEKKCEKKCCCCKNESCCVTKEKEQEKEHEHDLNKES